MPTLIQNHNVWPKDTGLDFISVIFVKRDNTLKPAESRVNRLTESWARIVLKDWGHLLWDWPSRLPISLHCVCDAEGLDAHRTVAGRAR
jgi:hypothetical protein